MRSVLVVSSAEEHSKQIFSALGPEYTVDNTDSRETAVNILGNRKHQLTFIDTELFSDSEDYQEALDPFINLYPNAQVILMTPPEWMRKTVKLLKAGASDCILFPINAEEVRLVVKSAEESTIKDLELDYLRDKFWQTDTLDLVRTENTAMRKLYEKIRAVAPTKATILISGETGSGKGVLARLIHIHSQRRNNQFISVHCGAIPDTLLESELFGHEKGSFTGAHRKKLGKFEIAKGGTIFLDEIGTISPESQIKLLQVLQDGTYSPVGSEITVTSDARVIAATNTDLQQKSENGTFRKDLYYRLNVFPIEVPPLRERHDDIPYLSNIILKRLNSEYGKKINQIHPAVTAALKKYSWPGNIRELENLMERAYLLESTPVLTPENFPEELFEKDPTSTILPIHPDTTRAEARKQAVKEFERQYLKELLSRNRGKVKVSADEAGITTRQLNKLMLKYEIRKEIFKT
ncbi:MAG: sigma-54-dependent Fis family transcriptional regulator [Deltaproteobacteria bacterium]|nr:MAG: sigma-54-dependent Fis family transcriptional regulator [Deltaproteobacteria bacterium]